MKGEFMLRGRWAHPCCEYLCALVQALSNFGHSVSDLRQIALPQAFYPYSIFHTEDFLYGIRDTLPYGIQEMTSGTFFIMLWLATQYHRVVFVFLGFLHQINWDALRNPAFNPTFHALAPFNCPTSELASVPRYCSARTRNTPSGSADIAGIMSMAIFEKGG